MFFSLKLLTNKGEVWLGYKQDAMIGSSELYGNDTVGHALAHVHYLYTDFYARVGYAMQHLNEV